MKTRGLFLSTLMMGAVLAGCSNAEEVIGNESVKSSKDSDNYVSVIIASSGDANSRATDGTFVAGSGAENVVNDAWFVFFNEDGDLVEAVKSEDMEWETGSGSVEKISTTIVLSNPQTWPTQVVALLNTGMVLGDFNEMDLNALKAKFGDYSSTTSFVMSNSVYKDGNKVITTTPLTDANICSSPDKAKQNPISIPVERVLAKVEAFVSSDFKVIEPDVNLKLDGQDVDFDFEITGMQLVDTNPHSYLLKNIDGVAGWEGWNDAANWRSYWATSVATTEYGTNSYNGIANASENDDEYFAYCHENTSKETPTKLLVTAQFKEKGGSEYETIIKYNGTYFTVDGLKNHLNKYYFADITYAEGESSTNNWLDYMTFVSAGTKKEWEVKLALVEDAPKPIDTKYNLEAIVADINTKTMSQWTDGKCYYYVNVQHDGSEGYNIGIVRNHWYNITIKSIKGLGTPVFNPETNIIPGKLEEEEYHVAAEVKILKWKMVSQTVDLN